MIVLVVASAVYLYSELTSKPKLTAPTVATISALNYLVSYDFVTAAVGWALVRTDPLGPVQGFQLFRTDDRGNHWRQQFIKQSTEDRINAGFIQFLDKTHGFMGVSWEELNELELYRTVDGGVHWVTVALPAARNRALIGSFSFSDSSHGWFFVRTSTGSTQQLNLYTTDNAGDSWQRLADPPSDSIGMAFRGPSEGWIGNSGVGQPHVYSSRDGGRSWQRHDLPRPSSGVPSGQSNSTSVNLLPGAGVVAFFSGGDSRPDYHELTSFDGGVSWKYVAPRPSGSSFGGVLSFQDALHWWAIDGTSLYKSPDAGQTWTLASNALPNGLHACQIFDSRHAWARVSAEERGLVRSDDGGRHWSRVTIPLPIPQASSA